MVVGVVVRDMQSQSQIAISFESSTLVVTFEGILSSMRLRYASSGIALDFLFLALAVACYDDLERARFLLLASRRSMTWLFARMTTSSL